jgi:hypothetical protein
MTNQQPKPAAPRMATNEDIQRWKLYSRNEKAQLMPGTIRKKTPDQVINSVFNHAFRTTLINRMTQDVPTIKSKIAAINLGVYIQLVWRTKTTD